MRALAAKCLGIAALAAVLLGGAGIAPAQAADAAKLDNATCQSCHDGGKKPNDCSVVARNTP